MKLNYPLTRVSRSARVIAMPKIKAVIYYIHECSRCGHHWENEYEHPRQCPKCWSRHWDKEEVIVEAEPINK